MLNQDLRQGGTLVSVVVLNHNGLHYLEDCLASLDAQTYQPLEIILVDNGSTDGSVDLVKGCYRGVRLLCLKENVGFAAGNNYGFRVARGNYVALLNNDAIAAPDWVEKLVQAGERYPEYAMFGSKILRHEAPERLDKVGHLMYWDGQNKGRGSGELDGHPFDQATEIFFPDGCAALYRRSLLEDVGGFDEKFFAYGDDADLGIRARLRGWKAYYVPVARVWHRRSGTAGLYSPQKIFWIERNRFWLAVKNFPLALLIASPIFTAYRFFWNFWYGLWRKGAAGNFVKEHSLFLLGRTVFSAYLDGLRRVAPVWRDRKEIRRTRRLSDREFFSLMKRFGISARDLAARE
ncbi:MAG: glycosyltransferase family 2 protein [Acidobacteria bacterium]|nr:glycosyltransferase family 2 protein [Acidobacteriota bacterium]